MRVGVVTVLPHSEHLLLSQVVPVSSSSVGTQGRRDPVCYVTSEYCTQQLTEVELKKLMVEGRALTLGWHLACGSLNLERVNYCKGAAQGHSSSFMFMAVEAYKSMLEEVCTAAMLENEQCLGEQVENIIWGYCTGRSPVLDMKKTRQKRRAAHADDGKRDGATATVANNSAQEVCMCAGRRCDGVATFRTPFAVTGGSSNLELQ